jgi:hypothetical protein
MRNIELFRRIAFGAYSLSLVFSMIDCFGRDAPHAFLIFPSVVLLPAILYFLGIQWCRFVVGLFSIFLFLFWIVSPLAQHAIDRTGKFWLTWSIVLSIFVFSAVMSFVPREKAPTL